MQVVVEGVGLDERCLLALRDWEAGSAHGVTVPADVLHRPGVSGGHGVLALTGRRCAGRRGLPPPPPAGTSDPHGLRRSSITVE